jgi:hypothetical protein
LLRQQNLKPGSALQPVMQPRQMLGYIVLRPGNQLRRR